MKMIRILVQVPMRMKAKLDQHRDDEHTSTSALIRTLLKQYFTQRRKPAA